MNKVGSVKAVSYLWVGSLLGAAFAFFTQVTIARGLAVDDFGSYSSALALVNIVLPLAAFGLPQLWLKIFGEEGWRGLRWINPSLQFAAMSTACVGGMLVLWGATADHSDSSRIFFWMLALFVIGQVSVELVSSKLQLEERYFKLALWQLFPHLFRFVLVLIAFNYLTAWNGLLIVGMIYGGVGFFLWLVSLDGLARIIKGDLNLVGHGKRLIVGGNDVPSLREVIIQAIPFGLAGMLHIIYFQGAVLLLAYLAGPGQAGVYNVAFIVMSAVYLFPGVIYQKFLMPKLHRWSSQDQEIFYKSYKWGSLLMLALGLLASLIIWNLAPYVLPLVFGNAYNESIDILKWLSLCAPLRFLATSIGSVLVTQNHIFHKVKCMSFVAVFSLMLSFILIPLMSINGALIVAFLSEALLLVMYFATVKRFVFRNLGET